MLDQNHFSTLEEMMGNTLFKLVASYIASADKLIVEISNAIEHNDAEKLMHSAHPLKSASRQIGANELGEMLETLEEAGKTGQLNGTDRLCNKAQEEYAAIKAELQAKMLPL